MTAVPVVDPDTEVLPPVERDRKRRDRHVVVLATIMFASLCLGMMTLYRPFVAPDELYQFDRVIAASHGQVLLDPTEIKISPASIAAEAAYVPSYQRLGEPSIDGFQPLNRGERPSFADLGGNVRTDDPNIRSNYMTQHPPLYYLVMGIAKNQIPDAEGLPVDQLVFWLRAFNVLMMLPLPLLFFAAARRLVGSGAVANAAAFLPLLLPGLARSAASINNDNLAILAGTALLVLMIRVMQGDDSRRTATLVAGVAIAGSLTKSNVLILLPFVLLAYGIGWLRHRRVPGTPTILTLAAGGIVSVLWSVRARIVFGDFQPDAMGIATATSQGPPRTAADPWSAADFFRDVWSVYPGRFWATLGVLEPPALPRTIQLALTAGVLICVVYALVRFRRVRPEMSLMFAIWLVLTIAVVGRAMLHNMDFVALPGLQGRYTYIAVLGLLLPVAFVLTDLLRQHGRWSATVVAAGGLGLSLVTFWVIVDYYWLPGGVRLTFGTVREAFGYIGGFSPWPTIVTAGLCALTAAGLVVPLVLLVRRTITASITAPTQTELPAGVASGT